MANSRNTRTALLMSLVSLLLCCAVFAGTTFAWLSEKTVSADNFLVGGNLELAVYKGVAGGSGVVYTQQVTDTSQIFDAVPWLPGGAQTVYLKLENKGRVPLQYELNLYAGAEVASMGALGPILLSDLLSCSVSENATGGVADVAALAGGVTPLRATAGVAMTDYESVGKFADTLAAGEVTYLTLFVCLPENADINCLPGKPVPSLEFGVTLAVSQLGETDMFGYTQTLPLPQVEVVSGQEKMEWHSGFSCWMTRLPGGGTVSLPGTEGQDAPAISFEKAPPAVGVPTNVRDSVQNYCLSVDGADGAVATVTLPVDGWDVSLYLDGVPLTRRTEQQLYGAMTPTQYDYNALEKKVTFLADRFPVHITMVTHTPALTVDGVGYAGLAEAFGAVDELPLSNDLRLSAPVELTNAAKHLRLSGRTVAGGFAAEEGATLSVGAGSLVISEIGRVIAPTNGYALYVGDQGVVTVENGDYSGGIGSFFVGAGGQLDITGGSFRFGSSAVPVVENGGVITVTGGAFVNFDPTPFLAEGYQVTVSEDVYTVSAVPQPETEEPATPDPETQNPVTPDPETEEQEPENQE